MCSPARTRSNMAIAITIVCSPVLSPTSITAILISRFLLKLRKGVVSSDDSLHTGGRGNLDSMLLFNQPMSTITLSPDASRPRDEDPEWDVILHSGGEELGVAQASGSQITLRHPV